MRRGKPLPKQVQIFLQSIIQLCDQTPREDHINYDAYYQDDKYDVEKAFIANDKQSLKVIGSQLFDKAIRNDLLARHLAERARQGARRRVPLINDVKHISDLAERYLNREFSGVLTVLRLSFTKINRTSGAIIDIYLDQDGDLSVKGSVKDLVGFVEASIRDFTRFKDLQLKERQYFLFKQVANELKASSFAAWRLQIVTPFSEDMIQLDGRLVTLKYYVPEPFLTTNYYQELYLPLLVKGFDDTQLRTFGRMLGKRASNYASLVKQMQGNLDTDDVHRALYYAIKEDGKRLFFDKPT